MEVAAVKAKEAFRDYKNGDEAILAVVKDNYYKMRTRQTVEYAQRMRREYLTFNRPMNVWDAMMELTAFVDLSDPDITLPNVVHLIQSAEAMREQGRPDWMQLTGLIHDLGKVMFLWGKDEDGTSLKEQWGLVGDIFILGCKLPDTCIYPEFNVENPDMANPRYNTELGMYEANCGLDNCLTAWGHDEYFFQVLKNHPENKLPEAAMTMIRYHSFYPWHTGNSYEALLGPKDAQYKEWIKDFNQYDLYTKCTKTYDMDEIKAYYMPLIEKYLGKGPVYF